MELQSGSVWGWNHPFTSLAPRLGRPEPLGTRTGGLTQYLSLYLCCVLVWYDFKCTYLWQRPKKKLFLEVVSGCHRHVSCPWCAQLLRGPTGDLSIRARGEARGLKARGHLDCEHLQFVRNIREFRSGQKLQTLSWWSSSPLAPAVARLLLVGSGVKLYSSLKRRRDIFFLSWALLVRSGVRWATVPGGITLGGAYPVVP